MFSTFSIPLYFFAFNNFVYCHSFIECRKALQFVRKRGKIHIIKRKVIKDLGLLPIIHMMRADIQTEVAPIVGTERESEELVHYLLEEFESDPKKLWGSNLFGKSLHELVNEELNNKLSRMPDDAREKLRTTLERIINEGSGGLICIIL